MLNVNREDGEDAPWSPEIDKQLLCPKAPWQKNTPWLGSLGSWGCQRCGNAMVLAMVFLLVNSNVFHISDTPLKICRSLFLFLEPILMGLMGAFCNSW